MDSITFLAAIDFEGMDASLWASLIVAIGLLIWDTIEVGRNDAANLVNAAYGSGPKGLALPGL